MASNMSTYSKEGDIEISPTSSHVMSDKEINNDFIYQQLTQRSKTKKGQFVIVTAGKAGVGKSTLINTFLELKGETALKVSLGPDSVTKSVYYCDKEINGVQLRVVDMPGLHAIDSGVRTDNNEDILGDLKGITGKGIDVVFFCFSFVNRVDIIDFENMNILTKAFGPKIWEHVIFVFTRTDLALHEGRDPEILVEEYVDTIRKQLMQKIKVEVEIKSIYSFPTDAISGDEEINKFTGIVGIPVSKCPDIPEKWRITLLLQIIRKCRKENIPALLQLNCTDHMGEVAKSAGIVIASGIGGAAVGTAVGATVGAIVGGVLTAPIGGVGACPTAAGGAELGGWIGTIAGSGALGLTALCTRIAFAVRSRYNIEERARLKIKEMAEKEKKLTVNEASQDEL